MKKVWGLVLGLVVVTVLGVIIFGSVFTPKVIPGKADEGATCPNPDRAACYDCNGDGEVNILDFACFAGVYGKSY